MSDTKKLEEALDAIVARGANIKDMKASEFIELWHVAKKAAVTSMAYEFVYFEYSRRLRGD